MMNALLTSVLALALLVVTTGCGRYYWSRAGGTTEQFTRDNQECFGQASGTLPPGAAVEAVEQVYRSCLNTRGWVRDKQFDPAPPGSFRGVEDSDAFAAATRTTGQAARQPFEQQLTQLDDLKARGRITDEEYNTMRRRLVEGVTPGQLTTPVPTAAAPLAAAATPALDGRWYGRNGATLDIRSAGARLYWEYEHVDRVTTRASGTGSAAGDRVSLTGRQTTGTVASTSAGYSFDLTRGGDILRGTSIGPGNVPASVEFSRARR